MKGIGGVSPETLNISFANVLQGLDALNFTKPGRSFISFDYCTPSFCRGFWDDSPSDG